MWNDAEHKSYDRFMEGAKKLKEREENHDNVLYEGVVGLLIIQLSFRFGKLLFHINSLFKQRPWKRSFILRNYTLFSPVDMWLSKNGYQPWLQMCHTGYFLASTVLCTGYASF
jgi:hypothetical protein